MDNFLTARQVQNILRVDRITVYRMLKDGRIKGVKIGQQWRFARQEVEQLVNRALPTPEQSPKPDSSSGFPTHCVQTIQDLFSDVSQISALVVDQTGEPITEISHPCGFCQMMMQSLTGQKACRASWKEFARQAESGAFPFTCHAGLQYIAAPIVLEEKVIGYFLAGEQYWQAPDRQEENERIQRLASVYNLKIEPFKQAAQMIPVIEPDRQGRIEAWPALAARAVHSILHERTNFVERLKQIADLTQIHRSSL